jgi:hypothetical protein
MNTSDPSPHQPSSSPQASSAESDDHSDVAFSRNSYSSPVVTPAVLAPCSSSVAAAAVISASPSTLVPIDSLLNAVTRVYSLLASLCGG